MTTLSMPSTFLKRCFRPGAILLTLTGLFWFTVNLWAERKLPFIEATIATAIHRPVTIERAHFNLISGFVLDGLEIKKQTMDFFPTRIEHVKVAVYFLIFPRPTLRIHRIVLESPNLSVRGKPEDLFKACVMLKALPPLKDRIGFLEVEGKLSSFEVKKGQVSILWTDKGKPWQQDMENVHFFVGRRWFQKNFFCLSGQVAGRPQAWFRIQCGMKNPSRQAMDSNIRVDFHEFTMAYLNPHLGGRFKLPDEDLTASVRLRIRDGRRVEVRGRMKFLGRDDVSCSLTGILNGDRLDFSSVSVGYGAGRLSGDGKVILSPQKSHYDFTLSSKRIPLIKFKKLTGPFSPESGGVLFHARLEGDSKRFEPSLEATFHDVSGSVPDAGISITHLDGRVRFSRRAVDTEELWAFVNNIPLRLRGSFLIKPLPSFRLELSTYPGQLSSLRSQNPLSATLTSVARRSHEGWSGYVKLQRQGDVPDQVREQTVWAASFHDLDPSARWGVRSLSFRRQTKGAPETAGGFSIHQALFQVHVDPQSIAVEMVNGIFYGGKAKASIFVDLKKFLWKANVSVTNANVSRVLRTLNKDYHVTGLLNFQTSWEGVRTNGGSMKTHFMLLNGSVGPCPASHQWAAQTGINILEHIRFDTFSGEVFRHEDAWELRGLSLRSDLVRMEADLKIRSQIVSGGLSVKFPTAVISASSDLKWLVDFVHASDWIDLNFKIAGRSSNPRVQWLSGEFKKKVESSLAPWMRNEFERQMQERVSRF